MAMKPGKVREPTHSTAPYALEIASCHLYNALNFSVIPITLLIETLRKNSSKLNGHLEMNLAIKYRYLWP